MSNSVLNGKLGLGTVLIALTALLVGASPATTWTNAPSTSNDWVGTWSAPPQQPAKGLFHPNWSQEGFSNNSVRQVIQISVGGAYARIKLSNVYGSKPLKVSGASIAQTADGAAVKPGSTRQLTFGRSSDVLVPAGGQVASDAVWLRTSPIERLTVTLYFHEPTGTVDLHSEASATSYLADGDQRFDDSGRTFDKTTLSWYLLSGVDIAGSENRDRSNTIVAFGDSITDGVNSVVDANNRYPDQLAERLASSGRPQPVLNAGIGGNRVVYDSSCFGEKATKRLQRDVLAQSGVSTVIVQEGINDIGHSDLPSPPCIMPSPRVTAQQLIASHREIIELLHANGIKAIGATLLPYKGSFYYTDKGNKIRHEFNMWMRTSGEYDAVVDFDAALADPDDREQLRLEYDSGDKLHPSDAGYGAMANDIDLSVL